MDVDVERVFVSCKEGVPKDPEKALPWAGPTWDGPLATDTGVIGQLMLGK